MTALRHCGFGALQKARVYSFEPDPRARERYLAKVKDERAILFDMAISDTNGVRDFYVSSGTPRWARITREIHFRLGSVWFYQKAEKTFGDKSMV